MENEMSTPETLLSRMDQLDEKFDELLLISQNQVLARDGLINRLHEDLEYYQKDSANRFENQLMKSVIQFRESMKKAMSRSDFETLDADALRKLYSYAFEDITDLLEQQNCDEIVSEPGDPFNAAIHQAKIEPTDDPALDKTVKLSKRAGYKKDHKLLIPENVIVYQYKEEKKD